MSELTRRDWLATLPALVLLPGLIRGGRWGPVGPAPRAIGVAGLHSATLAVTDVERSVDFYQRLFGCPVQARQGSSVLLRVGAGPGLIALTDAGAGPPRISRIGLAVEDFDPERLVEVLADHGLEWVSAVARSEPGPNTVTMTIRGDTTEIVLGDPEGLVVELQDPAYCGGTGPSGDACDRVEPAPYAGSLRLLGLSHFTNNVADPAAAVEFYRRAFDLDVQTHQGAAPLLGVGPGNDFLMFIGSGVGRTPTEVALRPGAIHHVCFTIADFSVEGAQRALEAHGIRPGAAGEAGAPRHWVSLRMPNRGGAPDGTPELYFSDPDGLSIQLQDPRYCGGGGSLGERCE